MQRNMPIVGNFLRIGHQNENNNHGHGIACSNCSARNDCFLDLRGKFAEHGGRSGLLGQGREHVEALDAAGHAPLEERDAVLARNAARHERPTEQRIGVIFVCRTGAGPRQRRLQLLHGLWAAVVAGGRKQALYRGEPPSPSMLGSKPAAPDSMPGFSIRAAPFVLFACRHILMPFKGVRHTPSSTRQQETLSRYRRGTEIQ